MKRILLVLFALTTLINAQTWEKVASATFGPLTDVFFYSENRGWIVGPSGLFAQTTDGGQTWTRVETLPNQTTSLYSIYFWSKMEGFVGSYGDKIYKTEDGGATWTEISVGEYDGLAVKEIIFAEDHQTGWCLTSASNSGEIVKTTNGGQSWSPLLTYANGDIECMAFGSDTHGVCAGGGTGRMDIWYTSDGQTWTKATNPQLPPGYSRLDIHGITMANENVAYGVGWGTRSLGLQPSILIKSTDGGATWTYLQQEPENRQYVNLYCALALDENTVLAGGGSAYEGSVIIKTTDGGANWYKVNAPFGFSVKAFNKVGNRIWAVGSGGVTIYSDDEGDNWQMANQIPSSSFWAKFYDGNDLMITGGYNGLLLISNDRGNTWNAVYAYSNGVCPNIRDIFFLNTSVGYLARNNRMVNKTTDGGLTWQTIMEDTTSSKVNNYAVQFVNENIGFVGGKFGSHTSAFYKTTDGGVTWESQVGTLPEEIQDMYFFDESKGIVVGKDLMIRYTTDGGETWNASTINGAVDTDDDIVKVTFYDENNGLAIGDELFKTTDGGITWDYVSYSPYSVDLNDGTMITETQWIVVGSNNVLETFDAGSTWNDIADLAVITANQLYTSWVDKTGYAWTTGGASEIYKTVDVVGVEESSDNPLKFELYQNYPNPFNPTTTISYVIPTVIASGAKQSIGLSTNSTDDAVQVSLKVYDILGNEVATLVNEKQTPGVYSVNFDASKLSSGVYFYQLEGISNFSNFKITKKMTLIK